MLSIIRVFFILTLMVAVISQAAAVAPKATVVNPGCDCDYHPGGCIISKAASPGNACKCQYKGAWTCSGFEVGCSAKNSLCTKPDKSRAACILGNGDCGGY